jgi:hypothetical protein
MSIMPEYLLWYMWYTALLRWWLCSWDKEPAGISKSKLFGDTWFIKLHFFLSLRLCFCLALLLIISSLHWDIQLMNKFFSICNTPQWAVAYSWPLLEFLILLFIRSCFISFLFVWNQNRVKKNLWQITL